MRYSGESREKAMRVPFPGALDDPRTYLIESLAVAVGDDCAGDVVDALDTYLATDPSGRLPALQWSSSSLVTELREANEEIKALRAELAGDPTRSDETPPEPTRSTEPPASAPVPAPEMPWSELLAMQSQLFEMIREMQEKKEVVSTEKIENTAAMDDFKIAVCFSRITPQGESAVDITVQHETPVADRLIIEDVTSHFAHLDADVLVLKIDFAGRATTQRRISDRYCGRQPQGGSLERVSSTFKSVAIMYGDPMELVAVAGIE